jgi:hypothetical protein
VAQLTFTARYKSDQRFNDAVQKIHLEAVLESAGISPEILNKAWESGLRPLSMSQYRDFVAKNKTPAKKKRAGKNTQKDLDANTDTPTIITD